MSITTTKKGRLCNQIIRNLALSFIAKKNNLFVDYSNYDLINNKLGIKLFIGKKKYNTTKIIKNDDYIKILNQTEKIDYNINLMKDYFQTEEISDIIYKYLRSDSQKQNIIKNNPFKDNYNNNNNLFIHIRLDDAIKHNVGINYYLKCIKKISFDKIYIASDSLNHEMIKKLKDEYPCIILIDYNPVMTIQFGSTCKYISLSHGTFSAVIGYLGFFSNIYYPSELANNWTLGLFTNKSWTGISK
jgi:hypothetical protein